MLKEIVLTPVEASSLLISSVFGKPVFSEEVARRLHVPPIIARFDEAMSFWGNIFQDTQKSQLLVDSVNRLLQAAQSGNHYPYLTETEVQIIRLRNGLEDGRIKTLVQTGEQIGKSGERTRQIEAKSLMRLRHPTYTQYLPSFVR